MQDIDERLEKRLGRLHARLRLGIEADHEAKVFGQGINYFHIENLQPSHIAIRSCLKLAGLYWRGRRNAEQIVKVHYPPRPLNEVGLPRASQRVCIRFEARKILSG